MSSCVSKKKFQTLERELKNQKELFSNQSEMLEKSRKNTSDSERSRAAADAEIRLRDAQIVAKENKIKDLETQIELVKANNSNLLNQMTGWNDANKTDANSIYKLIEQIDDLNRQLRKERIYRYGTANF
jgi:chromosome segregation ATPase